MYAGTQSKTRNEALAEVHQKFACTHDSAGIRARTISGGSIQFVYQCLRCGESVGKAVAKAKVEGTPPPFDNQLRAAWAERYKAEKEAVEKRYASAFWSDYAEYLASPRWAEKRQRVMDRAGGLCEGCRAASPVVVHHQTYEHLGNELLFELVALCIACHDVCHPDRVGAEPVDD
jgi:hypothetical protein